LVECAGVEYGVKSLPLQQGQCPSPQERERVREEITAEVKAILSGGAVHSCNGSLGWRRVGFVNMTDPSQDCPPGLNLTSHSIRTCGSSHHSQESCSSTTFSVGGMEYSQVCGRIKAYQYGQTAAFYQYLQMNSTIEQSYVGGVSLTHGAAGEREHIWTLAAGYAEEDTFGTDTLCPCATSDPTVTSPPFVGDDYFCETGNFSSDPFQAFFKDDPLWDGDGCGSNSTCCQFNNPPWFTKTLPAPTTDDIELRLCHLRSTSSADVPIELIELYTK
jgi:hypothetical protein